MINEGVPDTYEMYAEQKQFMKKTTKKQEEENHSPTQSIAKGNFINDKLPRNCSARQCQITLTTTFPPNTTQHTTGY